MMMIEQKLDKARATYRLKLVERLEALGGYITRLRGVEHEVDPGALQEAQQLAHRICGSAGTFGFAATGEAVKIIDQTLLSVLEEHEVATRALWDRLAEALRQAQEASQ